MECRPSRGRGGYWRRGGGGGGGGARGHAGGLDNVSSGERRGRGRGGHHRGRGKRDHYRGRGRGVTEDGATDCFRRRQDEQDDKENTEDEMPAIYSRRKLESNWDRYEESEKEEVNDDVPVQRGTDYHVLLTSAGDSFTQFRFSEEKDWEVDKLGTNQVPALFVDLEVLAHSLQELPLHQRLDLEPNHIQDSTPIELPSLGGLKKLDPSLCGFQPPAQKQRSHVPQHTKPTSDTSSYSHPTISPINEGRVDDADEELDLLLGLQKPVTNLSLDESETSNTLDEVCATPEKAASVVVENREEQELEVDQAVIRNQPEKPAVKQELTEEDLEDWLDSMIS